MNTSKRAALLILAGLLAVGPQTAWTQELFFVTGVSRPAGASLETARAVELELSTGRSLTPGTLHVVDGAQLMLFEQSGVVAVVLGPTTIVAEREELTNGIQLELQDGTLMFASATGEGEARPITVFVRPAEQAGADVEVPIGLGQTFVGRSEDRVTVAYVADGGPPTISPLVKNEPVELSADQRLTVDPSGDYRLEPLGDWVAQLGPVPAWGRALGVASAHASRGDVETNLFNNIIAWDRYAGATYVATRLRAQRFNIEIRQTVQTVAVFKRPTTRAAAVQTQPFNAANEVPLLSPAAASVQNSRNVGQGVTAILLNNNAARLLQATGSQGLGFRGLRQLAIPGFTDTGFRTLGPAGLGAQR